MDALKVSFSLIRPVHTAARFEAFSRGTSLSIFLAHVINARVGNRRLKRPMNTAIASSNGDMQVVRPTVFLSPGKHAEAVRKARMEGISVPALLTKLVSAYFLPRAK